MADEQTDRPVSLTRDIYPQPTSKPGRGQTYSRTPITLPDLPIEAVVTPIPWVKLLALTGLAALLMASVDWILGIWGGSAEGSLSLALVTGPFLVMLIIAALSIAFYRAITQLLVQAQLLYVRGVIWGSILCIFPITQGLRYLIMPELFAYQTPVFSHGVLYVIAVTLTWMAIVAGITGLLLRSSMNEERRVRTVIWIVIAPYVVAIPFGIIALVKALSLFP